MKGRLDWISEEEGRIVFLEGTTEWLRFCCFAIGEAEAELVIQDMVCLEEYEKNPKVRKKVISEMTECFKEAFRLLWAEGFEQVEISERKGTTFWEILDSAPVVRYAYSEYMMQRRIEREETTSSCVSSCQEAVLTEEEEGFFCENGDKTFFCRLLPYKAEGREEAGFYLYEVEVQEKVRNKGIATSCLKSLFFILSEKAPVKVYLQVGSYNSPAVHLYQKLGFEISEELCYYEMNIS